MHLVDDLQRRTDYLGKINWKLILPFPLEQKLSWRNEILKVLYWIIANLNFSKLNVKDIFSIGCGLKVKT